MQNSSPYDESPAPLIPGTIERARLLDRLAAATQYRLILFTAPAGYGKTTLASQFARSARHPVAWHGIDERERDIPNLYEHSVAALEAIAPGIRQSLPAPGSYSPTELATLIAEYVWASLQGDAFYILDDVHHLAGFPAAETWLQHLVGRLPKTCHLILLSRSLPTLPFAELIARNEVLAFGQEELRLTEDEIAQLAHQLLDDRLSTADTRRLVQRLDGWPAGVMLALQPLPSGLGDSMLSTGPEPEALFEALASSMLQAQLPDLRYFLLESSTLTRLTPELCSSVLGIANSAHWLNTAKTQNLFLTKVPGGLVYHTLFRDFLQKQLRLTDPQRFAELHEKAARWFEERDDIEEAFDHYLAAGLIEPARDIAERVAGAFFSHGKFETLLKWYSQLSRAGAEAPRLAHECAMIYTDRYEYEAAVAALERAQSGFARRGDADGMAKVQLQRARIELQQGQNHTAIELAEGIADSAQPELRGGALRVIGLAYTRLGEVAEGVAYLEEAVACYRSAHLVSALSHLLQDLQFAYTRLGRLEQAGACLQEVVALRRRLSGPIALSLALNNLGYYYHQKNDYLQALATFEEGLGIIAGVPNRLAESFLLWSLGDLKRDLALFDEAERLYTRALGLLPLGADPNLRSAVLISSAALRRRERRPEEAVLMAHEALEVANRHSVAFEQALARAVLWAARAELGQAGRALDELEMVLDELHEQGARFEMMGVLGTCARVALLQDEEEAARGYLASALGLARETGTAQPLAVEVAEAPALQALAAGLPGSEYLSEALGALRAARRQRTQGEGAADEDGFAASTYSLRVFTLGREEIERDGRMISPAEWRAAAAREMFLYLLFAGPQTRGDISLAFWPDSSADQVRANFHTTLHRARQALGADVIVFEKDYYAINPDLELWCDALEFERLAEQARLLPPQDARAEDLYRKATNLYAGEFLPSLDADWAYTRRLALADTYLEALVGLGRCARARHDHRAALDAFMRALEVDPYREETHREVMSCYNEMGERGRVLNHLEDLKRLFRRELAVEPTEETIAFARALLS